MKITPIPTLAVLLALAACSSQSPAPTASEEAAAEVTPVPVETVPASDIPSNPVPTAAPASAEFPTAMLGRWGLVPADCTSQKGDNKGMITVTRREIRFYESVAKIAAVKESSPTLLRGSFAYEGEGMQWTRDAQFEARPAAEQLVLQEFGDDAVQGPRTYTWCK